MDIEHRTANCNEWAIHNFVCALVTFPTSARRCRTELLDYDKQFGAKHLSHFLYANCFFLVRVDFQKLNSKNETVHKENTKILIQFVFFQNAHWLYEF